MDSQQVERHTATAARPVARASSKGAPARTPGSCRTAGPPSSRPGRRTTARRPNRIVKPDPAWNLLLLIGRLILPRATATTEEQPNTDN